MDSEPIIKIKVDDSELKKLGETLAAGADALKGAAKDLSAEAAKTAISLKDAKKSPSGSDKIAKSAPSLTHDEKMEQLNARHASEKLKTKATNARAKAAADKALAEKYKTQAVKAKMKSAPAILQAQKELKGSEQQHRMEALKLKASMLKEALAAKRENLQFRRERADVADANKAQSVLQKKKAQDEKKAGDEKKRKAEAQAKLISSIKSSFNAGFKLIKRGIVGALAGLGSLMYAGLKLAKDAAGNWRESRGLGLTNGQLRAGVANITPRLFDFAAAAGNVNKGLNDVSSPQYVALANQGLTKDSTSAATIGLYAALRKFAKASKGDNSTYLNNAKAYGFGSVFSDTDLIRARTVSDKEWSSTLKDYNKQSKLLNVGDAANDKWVKALTSFNNAIGLVKKTLETSLAPAIEMFSKRLNAFMDNPAKLKQVTEFFDNIDWAKVGNNIKEFGKGVGYVVEVLKDAIKGLKWVTDKLSAGLWGATAAGRKVDSWLGNKDDAGGVRAVLSDADKARYKKAVEEGKIKPSASDLIPKTTHDKAMAHERDMLKRQIMAESSGINQPIRTVPDMSRGGKPVQVGGIAQLTPAAWKDVYGNAPYDPMNEDKSLYAMEKLRQKYQGMFGGNEQAVLAAYHSGAGSVQKAMNRSAKNHKPWQDNLGKAGQSYVNNITNNHNVINLNHVSDAQINQALHSAGGF